jgi:hypothetical protein
MFFAAVEELWKDFGWLSEIRIHLSDSAGVRSRPAGASSASFYSQGNPIETRTAKKAG